MVCGIWIRQGTYGPTSDLVSFKYQKKYYYFTVAALPAATPEIRIPAPAPARDLSPDQRFRPSECHKAKRNDCNEE